MEGPTTPEEEVVVGARWDTTGTSRSLPPMAMYPRCILIVIIIHSRANPIPRTWNTPTLNTPWLTINSSIIKEVRGTSGGGLGWVGEMKEGAAMVANPHLISTNQCKKFHV